VRPLKSLQNYYRTDIPKGASVNISNLKLGPRAFAYWRADKKKFWIDAGRYEIMVGSSSQDIRLRDTISLPEGDGSVLDPMECDNTAKLPDAVQQITYRTSSSRVFVGPNRVHFNCLPDAQYVIYTCNGRMISQLKGSQINTYLSKVPVGLYLVIQKKQQTIRN
jgi:hypothetical protein